ncbi:hypothetical protein M0R45_016716 [Rubus argutus]|uniref:Uncharacterized protein n=1 Tax=Rubus argutus TaxID=59490 RepID=A0AAW1XUC7_RUBAR
MYFNHNHSAVKKNLNLIMFGSEGSCSTSSDGSCNNNQISYESSHQGILSNKKKWVWVFSLFSVDENKTDHKEKVVYFY